MAIQRLSTLSDGSFRLDGGAMFGVVPRVLWEQNDPADDQNRILLGLNCLLVEAPGVVLLVDTGVGDKEGDVFADQFALERERDLFDALAPSLVNTGVLLNEINTRIQKLDDGSDESRLRRDLSGLVFLIGKLPRQEGLDLGVQVILGGMILVGGFDRGLWRRHSDFLDWGRHSNFLRGEGIRVWIGIPDPRARLRLSTRGDTRRPALTGGASSFPGRRARRAGRGTWCRRSFPRRSPRPASTMRCAPMPRWAAAG